MLQDIVDVFGFSSVPGPLLGGAFTGEFQCSLYFSPADILFDSKTMLHGVG